MTTLTLVGFFILAILLQLFALLLVFLYGLSRTVGAALIIIIAWLLGAFQSEPKIIIPNIQTNNIIEQTTTLPQTCQNTLSFMDCIISSPLLS